MEPSVISLSSNFLIYENHECRIITLAKKFSYSYRNYGSFNFWLIICVSDPIAVTYISHIYYFLSSSIFQNSNHLFILHLYLQLIYVLRHLVEVHKRREKGKMENIQSCQWTFLRCTNKIQCLCSGPLRTFSLLLFLVYTRRWWMFFSWS